MILNGKEIKEVIDNKEIIIKKYTWDNTNTDLNVSKPIQRIIQSDELGDSHKIKLHVGYILRTLSDKKWLNPKWLFNEHDGIVDLRKLNNGQYKLFPGETVLVLTNEVLEFGNGYFGLVLSRVRHEEKGLIISSTYVDPYWKGVLQLVVTNHSERIILLQKDCGIANLIIFKMSQPALNLNEEQNGHFGLEWEELCENPTRCLWNDRSRSLFLRIQHKIHTNWKFFTGLGIVTILIILYNLVNIIYPLYSIFIK